MSQNQQQRSRPAKPPIKTSNYSGGDGGKPSRPPFNSQQQQQQQRGRGGGARGRGQRGRRGGRGQRGRGGGAQRNRNYQQQQPQQQYGGYQNESNQSQEQQPSGSQQAAPQTGAPMNTNMDNQQSGGGRRPPIKQTNNNMFAQFESSNQQQQQQQNSGQQQKSSKASKPPKPVQQQQSEEKPMADSNENDDQQQQPPQQPQQSSKSKKKQKSPSRQQSGQQQKKPPISQQTKASIRREPPWFEFTGKDKDPPVEAGWAHRVRQVLSGDTIRLSLLKQPNTDKLNPSRVKQITLDGIRAPLCQRFSNQKNKNKNKKQNEFAFQLTHDEPFAFEAREFVREFVMNKNVFYAVWKLQNTTPKRFYGDIYVQTGKNQRKSLTQAVVENGFAFVKDNVNNLQSLSEKEIKKLRDLQKKAEERQLNIWSYNGETDLNPPTKHVQKHIRNITWLQNTFHEAFAKKYSFPDKKKILKGIVDQVINGSTIRLELFVNDDKYSHANVVVNIAGVLAPKPYQQQSNQDRDNKRRGNKGKQQSSGGYQYAPEYDLSGYAPKAKEWTEERLLGQKVDVKILFAANRNIYAQIVHPGGRIGPSLLKKGLAEYEAWSAKACDNEEQKYLKAASDIAKKARLNIWTIKPPKASKSQYVTVIQVVSGDTIVVEDADGKNRERYTLSSIRAPRLGIRRRRNDDEEKEKKEKEQKQKQSPKKPNKDEKKQQSGGQQRAERDPYTDDYLAREAKEFVRKKCIGKQVRLVPEYKRKSQSEALKKRGFFEQLFASIYLKNEKNPNKEENLALLLIQNGFAEIIRHSKQQLERSEDYNKLQQSFEKAKKEKKGINISDKERKERMSSSPFTDYSGNDRNYRENKRIQLLNWLRNNKRKAIVEFIFSANRLKLLIPEKKAAIAVMLADIRCGGWNTGSGRNDNDPWRKKAKEYLERTINQREVFVKITATDMNVQKRGRGSRSTRGSRRGRRRGGGATRAGDKQNDQQNDSPNPNLLGHIYFKDKNIAEYLISEGLATVIRRRVDRGQSGLSAQRVGPPKIFKTLEDEAKKANKGVHEENNRYYRKQNEQDEKMSEERAKQLAKTDKTGKDIEVVISHIETATLFYVNKADDNQSLQKMNQAMGELKKNVTKPGRVNPGKHYAALYDGYYARAKVTQRDKRRDNDAQSSQNVDAQSWFVMFIDYGNRASIAKKQFAVLPVNLRKDKIDSLAYRCELFGLNGPDKQGNSPLFYEAGSFMSRHIIDKKVKMKILFDDQYSKTWYVDLMVDDRSINQLLAAEGFVTLQRERELKYLTNEKNADDVKEYVKNIKLGIDEAKNNHQGLYKYGDIDDDEDDNLDFQNQKKKKGGRR